MTVKVVLAVSLGAILIVAAAVGAQMPAPQLLGASPVGPAGLPTTDPVTLTMSIAVALPPPIILESVMVGFCFVGNEWVEFAAFDVRPAEIWISVTTDFPLPGDYEWGVLLACSSGVGQAPFLVTAMGDGVVVAR